MAIIFSYPIVNPTADDLLLGTDVNASGKPTKNFTIQSVIDLIQGDAEGLAAVLAKSDDGGGLNITNVGTVTGSGVFTAGGFTDGTLSISGGNLTTSGNGVFNQITGTLQTAAQPNVTSLGTLTGLKIGSNTPVISTITSSIIGGIVAPGVDTAFATTKAIVDYVLTNPGGAESLSATLLVGNETNATKISVNKNSIGEGGGVDFVDDSYLTFGDNADLTVFHSATGNKSYIKNSQGIGLGPFEIWSNEFNLKNAGGNRTQITSNSTGAVQLYYNNFPKFETLTGGVKATGDLQATGSGTFVNILNTGYYSDSSGDVGVAGQILSSTATGTNWINNDPLYTWSLEGTTIPSGTAVTITDGANITTTWDAANFDLTIATNSDVVTGSGAANQVTYWTGAQAIDGGAGFTFAGGATGQVTVAGTLQAGTLSDGTFSGSAGTYTGGVSITSSTFTATNTPIGFIGNASTATALASSGAIAFSGDVGTTGGPYTYTSGGALNIVTTISNTTVTGKTLDGYTAGTAGSIGAGDTILEAFEKVQASITATTGLSYEGTWDARNSAEGGSSDGGSPDLTDSAYKVNGHFYIVNNPGNAEPNGGSGTQLSPWANGDWVIYVASSGTTEWQKLDQSNEVLGSGTAQKIALWSGTVGNTSQTLASSLIEQNSANNLITIGSSANLLVQGNSTFGDANTDTTTIKGPATFEESSQFDVGISLGSNNYGTAGFALTSGGAANQVNTWTQLTTGTVTSVGLTETGNALTITGSPVTSSGTINIAGAGAPGDYINGELNLVSFPVLDNYQYWTLSDGTNTTNITTTGTATFASGTGIINTEASGTITTAIDYVGNNNAIEAAADGTSITLAATDKLWVSDADDNTIKQINVSQVSGVLDQNLAEVLAVNNVTGGTDIAVSAADDITFTDTSKALFGTGNDLQIFHNGTGARIENATGASTILSDTLSINNAADSETMAQFIHNGAVDLYHNGLSRFKTTTTGVEVVNTDANVPPTILLNQDSKNFTITQAVSGAGQIINSFGSLSLRNDGSINLQNNAGTYTKASFDSSISFSPDNLAGTATVPGVTIYQSTDATADGTRTRVYGNLQVDGNIIHADAGNSGTYNFDDTVNASSNEDIFSITGGDGACAFTVYFTCNTASYSVAKVYTVVHSYGTTVVYNKLVDSGPYGGHDFTPTFTGATNVLTCNIANGSGSISANISTTVILGASPQNLTVAAL
jgi:hypothetical protein